MPRSPYLHDIPLQQAQERFCERLKAYGLSEFQPSETILLNELAVGRRLAEPLHARRCSPHYHSSAMDGYAIHSSDTTGALPSRPVTLRIGEQAYLLDTGDPLPKWADAVVPVEEVEILDAAGKVWLDDTLPIGFIRLRQPILPWMHVRPVGEDLIQGQLIFPAGEVLRAADLGAIAAGGIKEFRVVKKPIVTIIPTGDELVPLDVEPGEGQISEFNSVVLAAQAMEWGAEVIRYPIIKDNREDLKRGLHQAAAQSDLVLVNAGSSAGREDHTASVIAELGEIMVHGVAVRPGHPVILGFVKVHSLKTDRWVPVIGVPGYPVSTVMTAEIFLRPLLLAWTGRTLVKQETLQASLTRKVTSPAGDDDYLRVILGRVNSRLVAAPISRGAGVTTSLARADGILVIPRFTQGLEAGETVSIQLRRSPGDIERNLITIGSHDLTLEVLIEFLARKGIRLVSSNVGSLGGLFSLSRGECHFSGSHLLDPLTGTYNDRDIQSVFPDQDVTVMRWIQREQGLLVQKGNPRRILSLEDLTRDGVTFVNRQRGAGTRILLDYELGKRSIAADLISGYEQEEFTHLGVAVAVSSGRADCGLGIAAAAAALDLDFIPLMEETYELIFTEQSLSKDYITLLSDIARHLEFQKAVMAMPGYRLDRMGELRFIKPQTELK